MSNTLINLSMSLDGYIAAKNESREFPLGDGRAVLHHWMLKGDTMLALYAGAGLRLYRMIAQQFDATVRYLSLENAILDVAEQDLREHRAPLDAAKAGDGERAAEIIRCHVGESGEVLAARHYNRSGGDVP